jgi:hypothetical protein
MKHNGTPCWRYHVNGASYRDAATAVSRFSNKLLIAASARSYLFDLFQ